MDNAPDVSTGAPAPSAPAPPPAESSPAPSIPSIPRDDAGYAAWRQTGEIPDPKSPKPSKSEDSATSGKQPSPEVSATSESAEGAEPEGKTAPGPEPGVRQEQRRNGAPERLEEILSDLKRAGLSPSELKTFRREAQARTAEPETTAQPPPPEPPKPLKKPVLDDYTSWDEYNAATDEFHELKTREILQEEIRKLNEHHMRAQAQQTANQKLEEAAKRYGENAKDTIQSTATAIFHDPGVHAVFKETVGSSTVIADLLYVMGSRNELQELLGLAKSDPLQAVRKVVLLEQLVQDELRKGSSDNGQETPERDETGKFVSQRPPAKRTTEAPPPTREVSGRASPPPDDQDAAFARNDVRAYFQAANRRDIAQRRGQ